MKEKLENISTKKKNIFFECTHCGFMTQYEVELKSHKLIHYI
jgi:ribosomal protein L44E